VTALSNAKYFITYILIARWEKGGTQKKKEFFETKEELRKRVSELMSNIRVGALKMYEIQEA
jgi:hypothetical protein